MNQTENAVKNFIGWMQPLAFGLALAVTGAGMVGCDKLDADVSVAARVGFNPKADEVKRLNALKGMPGGERTVKALDISGDGKVDKADTLLLNGLAARAFEKWDMSPESASAGLYHGPAKEGPSAFSKILERGDLRMLKPLEVREVAIEARWAAGQARMVNALGAKDTDLSKTVGTLGQSLFKGYNAKEISAKALCDATAAMDVKGLTAKGVHPIAVFDLDGTFWKGNISDAFLAALVHAKMVDDKHAPRLRELLTPLMGDKGKDLSKASTQELAELFLKHVIDESLAKEQRISAKDAFYTTVALLEGMTDETVRKAEDLAFKEGTPHFPPWSQQILAGADGCDMRQVMNNLHEAGFDIHVLTATLDILALATVREMGLPIDAVQGSMLEREDGKFTGKVEDSTYYTKGAIVRSWLSDPPLLVFGDSTTSDFPMMQEAVTAAIMVNARPGFAERDDKESGGRMVEVKFPSVVGAMVTNKKPPEKTAAKAPASK